MLGIHNLNFALIYSFRGKCRLVLLFRIRKVGYFSWKPVRCRLAIRIAGDSRGCIFGKDSKGERQ